MNLDKKVSPRFLEARAKVIGGRFEVIELLEVNLQLLFCEDILTKGLALEIMGCMGSISRWQEHCPTLKRVCLWDEELK
jgi:hypothetical protein